MQEATMNQSPDTQEDLIDSLLAISMLTQRMAQTLNNRFRNIPTTTQKGETYHGYHDSTGHRIDRIVRTL